MQDHPQSPRGCLGRWLYVSFENSIDDLIRKQLARLAQVSVTKLRDGSIDPDTLRQAWQGFASGAGRHLYYVQGTAATSVETIRSAVVALTDRYPSTYPVVVVDFLQRLALTGPAHGVGSGLDDMRGRVGLMAQRIRDMATALDCHVWVISSTNRQAYDRDKATPGLASGRESGDIEFAADAMISIARDPEAMPDMVRNTEPLQLKVVKNRHGDTGATITIHRNRTSLHMAEATRG